MVRRHAALFPSSSARICEIAQAYSEWDPEQRASQPGGPSGLCLPRFPPAPFCRPPRATISVEGSGSRRNLGVSEEVVHE
eukprot:10237986-Alexandrium_andersonii.AAC.1